MKEYEDLGYMTKTNDHNNETAYHLPHHPVVKTESLTTKLRQLNTVTYGQAAAPFLAIRSLVQTAIDNEDRNPVACDVIKNDFYVDDLLSGAENENLAYDLFNGVLRCHIYLKYLTL
ncbi:hypothetical protein QE152_g20729 [Popillia japonica]|uniref:Uncharacterized protein n=1 Tax=Popillia japonica TaxID=7064 RepID=A0AAW1KQR9_POPJA